MDKNQGYAILKAVMLENGRGFALGEHPTAHPAMSHGPAMMTKTACGSTNGVTMEMTAPRWNRILQTGCRTISVFITWGSGRPRLPVFTSIIRPSGLWTSGHSRSRPITSRMKFSITISASRWKMARSWLGVILPIPAP